MSAHFIRYAIFFILKKIYGNNLTIMFTFMLIQSVMTYLLIMLHVVYQVEAFLCIDDIVYLLSIASGNKIFVIASRDLRIEGQSSRTIESLWF